MATVRSDDSVGRHLTVIMCHPSVLQVIGMSLMCSSLGVLGGVFFFCFSCCGKIDIVYIDVCGGLLCFFFLLLIFIF